MPAALGNVDSDHPGLDHPVKEEPCEWPTPAVYAVMSSTTAFLELIVRPCPTQGIGAESTIATEFVALTNAKNIYGAL